MCLLYVKCPLFVNPEVVIFQSLLCSSLDNIRRSGCILLYFYVGMLSGATRHKMPILFTLDIGEDDRVPISISRI
ncbi:hypothetical protein V2J09_019013 [Rumex salicifolius]